MRNLKRTLTAFTTVLANRFSPERSKNGIVYLNNKDREKMKSILQAIATKTVPVNSKEHREFWKIIKKNGGNPNKIDGLGKDGDLIRILDSHMTRYIISFYEDALISHETGIVHLSNERKELGIRVSKERLVEDEEVLYSISKGIPIKDDEGELLFDDALIMGLLGATRNNYELMMYNITILFSEGFPKYK
ncbi:hypothetical protein BAS10_06190 [Elizabethkingia meningoseptica]|uniref:hypothetical protein n=1 Tax=Elizabethkingia meningoseptica TaxID=238 RepID=UPI00099B2242|nr:hypothetical protein [Elizabethkingia meningoseptica]OPB98219.1 hypothetical protein BAS10_06190 [Elizabethkingia meningoseptica]